MRCGRICERYLMCAVGASCSFRLKDKMRAGAPAVQLPWKCESHAGLSSRVARQGAVSPLPKPNDPRKPGGLCVVPCCEVLLRRALSLPLSEGPVCPHDASLSPHLTEKDTEAQQGVWLRPGAGTEPDLVNAVEAKLPWYTLAMSFLSTSPGFKVAKCT